MHSFAEQAIDLSNATLATACCSRSRATIYDVKYINVEDESYGNKGEISHFNI